MRRISFGMTIPQIENRQKTVTRRMGWKFLKPGDLLLAVDRVMGFKKGEKARELGVIRVVSVGVEQLQAIQQSDVDAEGFPEITPKQFVDMFCAAMKCKPGDLVTVIEFEYAPQPPTPPGGEVDGATRTDFTTCK